jgi:hypothetical protein
VLNPEMGICQEAKFWPDLGDWLHPYAVYDFTIDRKRDGPLKFLQGFTSYLKADAYTGYDGLYALGDVVELACWVHTRRYWCKVKELDPDRVHHAMSFITRLFQIEDQLRVSFPVRNIQGERDFAGIREARQAYSLPILLEFKAWLDEQVESK